VQPHASATDRRLARGGQCRERHPREDFLLPPSSGHLLTPSSRHQESRRPSRSGARGRATWPTLHRLGEPPGRRASAPRLRPGLSFCQDAMRSSRGAQDLGGTRSSQAQVNFIQDSDDSSPASWSYDRGNGSDRSGELTTSDAGLLHRHVPSRDNQRGAIRHAQDTTCPRGSGAGVHSHGRRDAGFRACGGSSLGRTSSAGRRCARVQLTQPPRRLRLERGRPLFAPTPLHQVLRGWPTLGRPRLSHLVPEHRSRRICPVGEAPLAQKGLGIARRGSPSPSPSRRRHPLVSHDPLTRTWGHPR
jgi:hypothetical protein